jgi:hypothetical protein
LTGFDVLIAIMGIDTPEEALKSRFNEILSAHSDAFPKFPNHGEIIDQFERPDLVDIEIIMGTIHSTLLIYLTIPVMVILRFILTLMNLLP